MKKKPAKKAAKKTWIDLGVIANDIISRSTNKTSVPKSIKKSKGKVQSSISGLFVKPEYAKKHKATTFTTKPSKNDKLVDDIKTILSDFKLSNSIKFSKIERLVYKN